MKYFLKWFTIGPPLKLQIGQNLIIKPKLIANAINNFFIDKVAQYRNLVSTSNPDPLNDLRNILQDKNHMVLITLIIRY